MQNNLVDLSITYMERYRNDSNIINAVTWLRGGMPKYIPPPPAIIEPEEEQKEGEDEDDGDDGSSDEEKLDQPQLTQKASDKQEAPIAPAVSNVDPSIPAGMATKKDDKMTGDSSKSVEINASAGKAEGGPQLAAEKSKKSVNFDKAPQNKK
jgi:hypothetical protein